MRLVFTPSRSLGPFILGAPAGEAMAIARFEAQRSSSDSYLDLRSFVSEDLGVRLEVRNNIIESVSSEVEFIINDVNIIGFNLENLESMLGTKASEVDSTQDPADPVIIDFDELGMQLVLSDNRIVSATCY